MKPYLSFVTSMQHLKIARVGGGARAGWRGWERELGRSNKALTLKLCLNRTRSGQSSNQWQSPFYTLYSTFAPNMGWFWGKNESKPPNSDPLRDLDPSLRDFLSKESPIKYKPAPPPPQQQSPNPTSSQPSTTTSPEPSSDTPHVPSESLYPDGRYAHLWANYKPLSAIEAESKTDQEKLLDVLEGYKERKAQIGRAAVENCVEEQLALNDCYDNGAWKQKMMMCRSENRAFERCYSMQSVCDHLYSFVFAIIRGSVALCF